jgi:citrate synthase
MTTIEQLVSTTLGIPVEAVTDDLAFNTIAEWDSLNHVNLMLALEAAYEREIDEDLMIELTTIRAIRVFAAGLRQEAS